MEDALQNRIARLMKEQGLYGRQKVSYRVQTTDSNHDQPTAPNRLFEAPKATAPNQLWVARNGEFTVFYTEDRQELLQNLKDHHGQNWLGFWERRKCDCDIQQVIENAFDLLLPGDEFAWDKVFWQEIFDKVT